MRREDRSLYRNIDYKRGGLDLVLTYKLNLLDLFHSAVRVVQSDLAVAFPHAHFDTDAEIVSLARPHVDGVALFVVCQMHDVFAGFQP